VNAAFFCFNKGEDVNEAKQYARQLNVDEKIRWLDVVPFGDLFSLMNDVDVIVDQLGEQWLGVGMWGALLGKPVISNLSNSFINEKFRDACFLHAENADQFASQLQKCESVEFRVKARRDNSKFACNKLSLESEFDAWGLPSRSPRDNDC
jgi:glycosyltransferase involved in cell wall biosynthesis